MDEYFKYMDWQEMVALVFFIACWIGYARY